MIEISVEVLANVAPLLLALKEGHEGKSQKEIAEAMNMSEAWLSRRVWEALQHDLVRIVETTHSRVVHGVREGWATWREHTVC